MNSVSHEEMGYINSKLKRKAFMTKYKSNGTRNQSILQSINAPSSSLCKSFTESIISWDGTYLYCVKAISGMAK